MLNATQQIIKQLADVHRVLREIHMRSVSGWNVGSIKIVLRILHVLKIDVLTHVFMRTHVHLLLLVEYRITMPNVPVPLAGSGILWFLVPLRVILLAQNPSPNATPTETVLMTQLVLMNAARIHVSPFLLVM